MTEHSPRTRLVWNPAEKRLRLIWRLAGLSLFLAFLLALGQIALGFLAAGVSPAFTAGLPGSSDGSWSLLALFSSGSAVILSVWAAAHLLDRRSPRQYGFAISPTWLKELAWGLGLGAALMTVIFLLELGLGWIRVEAFLPDPQGPSSLTGGLGIQLAAYTLIGFYEELLNRGYLIKNLSEGFLAVLSSPSLAVLAASLISAACFGLLHAANPNSSLGSTLNICLAGVFLGAGFLLTGQLAVPIGLHISWNFFQGSIYGFPVSGASFFSPRILQIRQLGPDLWTGGPFGPEGGLLGTFVMLLGLGLQLVRVQRRSGQLQLHQPIADYHSGMQE